ncbi:MAG TPA: FeoB-associated Cys-rich membrane protein [Opitutaceae bacterium]|nr:FeoB-associated Cys-rich membrane protein [Opitutaceae bacterium]
MSQTLAALLAVAVAAAWLVLRAFAKGRKPGCGGDCGCASQDLREKARSQEKLARTDG